MFSGELVLDWIKVKIVLSQSSDMSKPFNMEFAKFNKETKIGHCRYHAVVDFADTIEHILRLQPFHCIPSSVIGSSLCHRTMLSYLR
jgi:hypothetical protein